MRMCSLASRAQAAHSRKTALNSTHCSSSHAVGRDIEDLAHDGVDTRYRDRHDDQPDIQRPIDGLILSIFRLSPSEPATVDSVSVMARIVQSTNPYLQPGLATRRDQSHVDGGRQWEVGIRMTYQKVEVKQQAGRAISTPGDAHMASDTRPVVPTVDYKVVALRLAADGLVDRRVEQIVVGRRAQRRAQIGGVFLAEAGVERARAGDPHPVAGFAEIVGQRRDEPQLAAGFLDADVAGGTAGRVRRSSA